MTRNRLNWVWAKPREKKVTAEELLKPVDGTEVPEHPGHHDHGHDHYHHHEQK